MGHRLPLRRPRHRASVYAAAWQRRTCVESSDCLCSMDILGHLVAFRADLHSVFGRVWCGILCPEGALSEFASRHGRSRPIPRWMRWGGWPFVAFSITTVYGQMVSV